MKVLNDVEQPPRPHPDMRRILGSFATGVVVLTAHIGDEHIAVTMNSFSSVSLEPALISICLGQHLRSRNLLQTAEHFCISILGAGQSDISQRCAAAGQKIWDHIPHRVTQQGIRVISPSLAVLHCKKHVQLQAGDHTILIGEITDAELGELEEPLLFFGSRYAQLGRAAHEGQPSKVQ